MTASFAALADSGNNLVIDAVVSERPALTDLLRVLAKHRVYLVGVSCSTAELERRERERGNRQIGLATANGSMHAGVPYDIEVNTTVISPKSCAEAILEQMESGNPAGASKLLADAHEPEMTPQVSDQ